MLVAIDKDTNNRIEAPSFTNGHQIRMQFPHLKCPFCESDVFPRDRQGFLLHFVHKTGCTTTLEHHPESIEHLKGKAYLAQRLSQELKQHGSIDVFLEYVIPEAGEHGRIADVAAVFPTGYVLVYECQLASITTDQLQKRTDDYASAGADVVWWFGKAANNYTNKEWSLANFGVYLELGFNFTTEFSEVSHTNDSELQCFGIHQTVGVD
jgi:competence protein CoiA